MSGETSATAEALEVLGDETRVAIVEALIEYRRDNPRDPGLPFSELRERTGVRDSGRFNYHLDRLKGRFVESHDGEYLLSYAGRELAGAILSGTYDRGVEKGPLEVGECPRCGASMAATYEDGYVEIECADGHQIFFTGLPPGAVAGRSMSELLDLTARTVYYDVDLARTGTCPLCYGTMTNAVTSRDIGAMHDYRFEAICDRCGMYSRSNVGLTALMIPEVRAFFTDHGRSVRDQWPWELDVVRSADPVTAVSEDPLTVRVDVELDGDVVTVTLDEDASVQSVDRG